MKRVLVWWLEWVTIIYVFLTHRPPVRLKAGETASPPKVIAVISNTALGDTLLSTPIIQSARISFPQARLIFIVHPRYRALFYGTPGVDLLLCYDGSYSSLVPAVMLLRKHRPDAILLSHSNAPQDIPYAVLSGASLIFKPVTTSPFKRFLARDMQAPSSESHVINTRLALLTALGGTVTQPRMLLPVRYATSLPSGFPIIKAPSIGFQLGAANTYKIWPPERFGELAGKLLAWRPNLTIVLTGSSGERPLAEQVLHCCNDNRVQNQCGRYRVEDLPWLLKQLSMLVSNDTGTMHMAIALGIPTVCLFGTTSSKAIGPHQDLSRHLVLQSIEHNEQHLPKRNRSNKAMLSLETGYVFAHLVRHYESLYPDAHPADN